MARFSSGFKVATQKTWFIFISCAEIDSIKGCWKKNVTHSKFKNVLFPRTICPRRLSFSLFVVLMRTTSCEKDSLLGQLVLGKKQLSNFERVTFFFQHPLFTIMQWNIWLIDLKIDSKTITFYTITDIFWFPAVVWNIWHFCFSNERTQRDALQQFYEDHDGSNHAKRLKLMLNIGYYGIPFSVLSFCAVYWAAGLIKSTYG